jgi:hypothetical protein
LNAPYHAKLEARRQKVARSELAWSLGRDPTEEEHEEKMKEFAAEYRLREELRRETQRERESEGSGCGP